MSYAKLTSACLAGLLPFITGHQHRHTPFGDDNWQSPQPLKQLEPRLAVSDAVSALNKSARVWFRLPHVVAWHPWNQPVSCSEKTRLVCSATSQWVTESTSNCVDGGRCPFQKYTALTYSQIISKQPCEFVFSTRGVLWGQPTIPLRN